MPGFGDVRGQGRVVRATGGQVVNGIHAKPGEIGAVVVDAADQLRQQRRQVPDGGAFEGQILETKAPDGDLSVYRTRRFPGAHHGFGGLRQIRGEGPEQQFSQFGEEGGHRDFVRRHVGTSTRPAQGQLAGEMGAGFAGGQAASRLIGFRAVAQ